MNKKILAEMPQVNAQMEIQVAQKLKKFEETMKKHIAECKVAEK